jgi:membrane protease YdiL (CAAX protease family)
VRAAKAIAIYGLSVIFLSALFAPWIFWLLQTVVGGRVAFPFHRVFNRVILVVAALGLWPLLRAVGTTSVRELGFVRVSWWWKHLLVGLVIGAGSLSIAGGLLILTGARTLNALNSPLVVVAIKSLAIGLIVGLIEETFFRGGLQTVFRRAFNSATAVLAISVVYAFAHYLKPRGAMVSADAVTWFAGFDYVARVVAGSIRAPGFALGMITYALAGINLGVAFARTGALYFSIGLHAGWVMLLKTFSAATRGSDILTNAWTWPALVVVLALVTWLTRSRLESVASRAG